MLLLNAIALPARRAAIGGAVRGALGRVAAWCAHCYARHEQRRDLAELDARMLKDVGIAPADAAEEIRKPFWRP
jgi:uncharacterized protein YjiS (DUF1127 family)